MKTTIQAGLFFTAVAFSGCANMQRAETPDLYPGSKPPAGGKSARAAEQYCLALADEYVQEPDRFKEAAKSGLGGAAIGGGVGALGGVIMKDSVGRALGAGAAIGGILGVVKSLNETGTHSPSYQRFVEKCLDKQGYDVVGWSVKPG